MNLDRRLKLKDLLVSTYCFDFAESDCEIRRYSRVFGRKANHFSRMADHVKEQNEFNFTYTDQVDNTLVTLTAFIKDLMSRLNGFPLATTSQPSIQHAVTHLYTDKGILGLYPDEQIATIYCLCEDLNSAQTIKLPDEWTRKVYIKLYSLYGDTKYDQRWYLYDSATEEIEMMPEAFDIEGAAELSLITKDSTEETSSVSFFEQIATVKAVKGEKSYVF